MSDKNNHKKSESPQADQQLDSTALFPELPPRKLDLHIGIKWVREAKWGFQHNRLTFNFDSQLSNHYDPFTTEDMSIVMEEVFNSLKRILADAICNSSALLA